MAHAVVVLDAGGRDVKLGPVGHDERCRLGLVEDIALLALAARRLGWRIRLVHASEELSELLDLVGLAEVLAPHGGDPPPRGPLTS